MSRIFCLLTTFLCCLSLVSSHAVLSYPPPRDGEEVEPGLKIANFPPRDDQLAACVGVGKTAGAVKATFEENSVLTVKWKITIAHTVWINEHQYLFIIYSILKTQSDPGVRVAVQFTGEKFTVLVDKIDVNQLQTNVKLPAGKSGNAIIQWVWSSQQDGGVSLIQTF
ncbi:hypothetical protein HK096_006632 [Nowakowskiella sp. JEL0078]|nr:hypothetical protein HK096_006632 [Nowakowskiella sp. JEL0078]